MNKNGAMVRIGEIEQELLRLPKGRIVIKNIKGKEQPYLQWYEDGKTQSQYVKLKDRELIPGLIARREQLTAELEGIRSAIARGEYTEEPDRFRTNVTRGDALCALVEGVELLQKRDCFTKLWNYLNGKEKGRVCLLYGIRRTGKTTLLLQAIHELTEEQFEKTVYIKARVDNTMGDMNHDLRLLKNEGCQYVFIDEVTLLKDFIDSASIFSDIFAMMGMRVVLSGTDSLGFWMSLGNELYDRARVIHTTYIPFREFSRLLGIHDVDEYIRYGGLLRAGEVEFEDPDALDETASYRDDESTRRYIDTAICKNIQHSLACCRDGNYFRHLRSLYDAGELTNAIQRVIEKMNHQFLIRTFTQKFQSHDLGSAKDQFRKQADEEKRTDILENIDEETVTRKLMEMLEIRNQEDMRIGITDVHVQEIREYLAALELVMDCPSESVFPDAAPLDYVLFTQPGMRYSQAQALVHVLVKDPMFGLFNERDRKLACEKILEDVKGRMMEDIVLLDTMKSMPGNKRAFKLTLSRWEYDMVIYDSEENSCEAYETKHSDQIVAQQYRALADQESVDLTEKKYGIMKQRGVIYRGESTKLDNGIEYLNVEEYLKSLG